MGQKPGAVLAIDELPAYLKIPKSTLCKLVREGKVPRRKLGRHWRFRKEAIDRWLEDPPAAPSTAPAGTHGDRTNRRESRVGRTEGVSEGREPGNA
ncbi:MAG: hypothetical protein Kow00109_13500 [Acidobacteriota bacterium]